MPIFFANAGFLAAPAIVRFCAGDTLGMFPSLDRVGAMRSYHTRYVSWERRSIERNMRIEVHEELSSNDSSVGDGHSSNNARIILYRDKLTCDGESRATHCERGHVERCALTYANPGSTITLTGDVPGEVKRAVGIGADVGYTGEIGEDQI